MNCPDSWKEFDCTDYLESSLSDTGWWDEPGQIWYVEPADRAYIDDEAQMLVVGRPGTDGMLWGYRKNHRGIWLFHPSTLEYRKLADTVDEFRDGYSSGSILV